jgi:hypothetical protein
MLYTTADFIGQYRLDSNAITQADYQNAIDMHERRLLEYFFDADSMAKITAAVPASPPAVGVRKMLKDAAIPFIFAGIKMGVGSSIAGEPSTQGYTRMGYPAHLPKYGDNTHRRLRQFAPFIVQTDLTAPASTIPYPTPIPEAPDFVAVGDPVKADTSTGEIQTTVAGVTATAITLAATLPAGPVRIVVDNLRIRIERAFLTF